MSSLLHGGARRTGDPLLDVFNPLAQFSAQTLREHNETLGRLRAQQEAIAVQCAQLANQESDNVKRHLTIMDTLSREEADVLRMLQLNKGRVQDLEKRGLFETATRHETIQLDNETTRELEEESISLTGLEDELKQMERSILDKLAHTAERSRIFGREFQAGMSVLQQDRHDVRVLSSHTASRITTSPVRVRAAVAEGLPRTPVPPPVDPPRRHGHGVTVSDFLNSSGGNAAPLDTSSRNGGAFTAPLRSSGIVVVNPDRAGRAHTSLSSADITTRAAISNKSTPSSFEAIGTLLQEACARPQQDVGEITTILRADQKAVDHMDMHGNQPLHTACSSPGFSVPAIQALLLAGASTTSMNARGMTPFHIACCNPHDRDHALKRFFIFTAAQDPNQRTAKGETAAHLCAEDDAYLESLKFLAKNVDLNIVALLTDMDGQPRRMRALEKAKACGGRATRCRQFLEALSM